MTGQSTPTTPGPSTAKPGKQRKSGTEPPVQRRSMNALLIAIGVTIVGTIVMCCTGGFTVGLIPLILALSAIPVSFVVVGYDAPWRRPDTTRYGVVLMLVMWVSLTAGLAGLTGQIVKHANPSDFYGRYGTRVTASLPHECSNAVTVHGTTGLREASADYVCDGSTWKFAGTSHTGTIVLGWDDVNQNDQSVNIPATADAYVIGDKGYSVKRIGKIDSVVVWEKVPAWLLLGLPAFILGVVGLVLVGRTNSTRPQNAPPPPPAG